MARPPVFNDIAIAIRSLFQQRRIGRAAVVDLDVHQGDGTARLFEDEPAVLTLSLHGGANFPFRKQASDLDIDLRLAGSSGRGSVRAG